MRSPRPFQIFVMVILVLTPLAQGFWFTWAWRVIDAVAWPGPRVLLQGLWVVAVLIVLAAGLDLLGVRVIPRQALRPWGRAVARLWLIASCIGIVHLSDLHIGDFMPRAAVRRAVDLANGVRPDLAVVTGDLITSERDPLEDCIAELSRLRAPLGVWGCHGNHERWAGVEARGQALFERYGMRVLRQQCAELSWHGGRFNLIGVDDQRERARPGEPSFMLRGIEALVRRDIPNILLSHNPDTFPRAAALGIELSLAGHTHGGQLRFALGDRQWSPASFVTPFVAGLYRLPLGPEGGGGETVPCPRKSAFLYVNQGLGTFGLPVRLGVPPEITVLTLRAGG
jgi:uncharacterized protein